MADLRDQLARRDPARAASAARDLEALGAMVGQAAERQEGVQPAEAVQAKTDAIEDALGRRDARGVEGADGRVGLRPDRAHARSHGVRGRRGRVPPGRAGAARGLRVLRVRARAAAAVLRPGSRDRRRGPHLVRSGGPGGPRGPDRRPRAAPRGPRDPAGARREAGRLGGDARRRGQQGHGRHELRADRLPRGPRGGAHPRRDHRVVHRRPPPAAAPRADRRARRPARLRPHLGARADAAAVAPAVRREARGGGGADRDRRPAADHELVLPPRVLERVDRPLPPPAARADGRRAARLLLRPGAGPRAARAHERLPGGLRDGPLPAVAGALGGHGDRARGRGAGARGDLRGRRLHVLAAAQAAVQEDADRHRHAAGLRARGDGRADGPHDAGHGLAADHAGPRRRAVLVRACGSASSRRGRRSARRSWPSRSWSAPT